ncbi:MAG: TM1812 family CRISPR-associated protein [Treponema sp.]|nr:TM1812 family CRISPR-associated protein [Treponema sp.]
MSKTKTFISIIPFQAHDKNGNKEKDSLKSAVYPAKGNSKLEYGATRFPIIPVINGYAEKGDKIRVIAILTDGDNFNYNYETYFKTEISDIIKAKELILNENKIEIIRTADSEDTETQLKLFLDIIISISDHQDIYACITYGTKPTPIIESMALNYAYKIKKDVSVGCIVYGRYVNDNPTLTVEENAKNKENNGIYDTTSLFYLDSIVNKLADMKVPNPEKAIRAMLGIGDNNEH